MPPARPFWKGYLELSVVSCPIAIFPASSSSERVSFRQINKKTGHRLKQQLVDSVTGEVVGSGDKGRGYQIGKDEYLPVEDEELDSLRLESTKIIDLGKFVPRSEIDERYLDSLYYLTPEDKVGRDAFAVIREAMKRKNMVGLGKVVISRRERIVMLEPFDKGLVATTLRYAYEVREAKPYFEDIPEMKLPDEMVKLAEHILETKAGHFNPAEFEDRYETAVIEMLKQKQAGLPPRKEARSLHLQPS
jgi:DNA end-binding protein Ku